MPLLLVSITATFGAENEKGDFKVQPVADYPHRQTSERVTVAVRPYVTDAEAAEAFGKVNPYRMGVLPVLIVIQNDGPDAIKIDGAKFEYELPDHTRIESTPAEDIRYLHGVKPPKPVPDPFGGLHVPKKSKNPLDEWEIEGRSLTAKLVPAGQSASGFVYFQSRVASAAASVYISGLTNLVSGKELYYFEIPMSGK